MIEEIKFADAIFTLDPNRNAYLEMIDNDFANLLIYIVEDENFFPHYKATDINEYFKNKDVSKYSIKTLYDHYDPTSSWVCNYNGAECHLINLNCFDLGISKIVYEYCYHDFGRTHMTFDKEKYIKLIEPQIYEEVKKYLEFDLNKYLEQTHPDVYEKMNKIKNKSVDFKDKIFDIGTDYLNSY